MKYILGFIDYDGTRVFLKHKGNTEFPEEATVFDSLEKAAAAKKLERNPNVFIYELKDGETLYVKEQL